MTKYLKLVVTAIVAVITVGVMPIASNAQITYTKEYLSLQGAPMHTHYGICIDRYSGVYWTCNTSNFFLIDVSPANPRIAGTGNKIVFYNRDSNTFNNIQVASVLNYSDARAKENIKTLDGGLNTILNLRPVTYTWKSGDSESDVALLSVSDSASVAFGPAEDGNTQYGFLAQEVEKVMPDAVATDEEGHKLINYTAIIPVLVQSIQELQGIVEEQKATISNLKSKVAMNTLVSNANTNTIVSCSPNPTQGDMTFSYEIEEYCTDAYILICNLSGNQEMKIDGLVGQSSVTKNLGSLNRGMHIATLVVNNEVQDSKQIIVD